MKNLIESVKKIDQSAAEYLEKEVKPKYDEDDPKFYKMIDGKRVKKDDLELLSDLFIWELSPQKNKFWKGIFNKLGKNGNRS